MPADPAATPLKWTRTPPTDEGWWWSRSPGRGSEVVELNRSGNIRHSGDFMVARVEDDHYRLLSELVKEGYEWSSAPVPPPEESRSDDPEAAEEEGS